MKVSVCICTWNRAVLLDRTLASLKAATLPCYVVLEIVVVDNNSTDHTSDVLSSWQNLLPLIVAFEPRPGQTWARNCALQHATGDLVIWTDDDVVVDANWIAEYVKAAEEWPDASFFGGTITPMFEIEPPAWLQANLDALESPLVVRSIGEATRPFEPHEHPLGANMAFRRDVAKGFAFDVKVGHRAGCMFGGDETKYVAAIRAAGHSGLWIGAAKLRHFIPAARMTPTFLAKWCADNGTAEAREIYNASDTQLLGMPRWGLRLLLQAELSLLWALLCRSDTWVKPFMQKHRIVALLREWRAIQSRGIQEQFGLGAT